MVQPQTDYTGQSWMKTQMGRTRSNRVSKDDQREFPMITQLIGCYLNQDASLVSGSLKKAYEELVCAALRRKKEFYAEMNRLLEQLETSEQAEAFFLRHSGVYMSNDYRHWFERLLHDVRKAAQANSQWPFSSN